MSARIPYIAIEGLTEEQWWKLSPQQRQYLRGKHTGQVHRSQTPEAKALRNKTWRTNNVERVRGNLRRSSLQRKYGISVEDYDCLLQFQGGGCAICKQTETKKKRLAVDHDHSTGKIRGLLCTRCNTAIGLLKDSIVLCENAAGYLKYYRR